MARDFTASSDKIDAGTGTDWTTATTVACWVKADSWLNDARLVHRWNSGSTQRFLLALNGTKKLTFTILNQASTGQTATGATTLSTTGRWYHFAGTFNPSTRVACHIDGVEDGANTTSIGSGLATGSPPRNFLIGRDAGATAFNHDGQIAEVAAWNAVLSTAELAALAKGASPLAVRPGLLKFYLPLWGAGSPEIDLSGNGNTGTLTGTASADHAPVASPFPFFSVADSTLSPLAGVGIAGLVGSGASESLFAETGVGIAGLTGSGVKAFVTGGGNVYAKASFANVGLVASGSRSSVFAETGGGTGGGSGAGSSGADVQTEGVSLAFGEGFFEPNPTWTRIG